MTDTSHTGKDVCYRVLAELLALIEALGYVDPIIGVLTGVAKIGASSYSLRDLLLLMSKRCKVKSMKAIKVATTCGFLDERREEDLRLFYPTQLLLPLALAYDIVLDECPSCRKVYANALKKYRSAVLKGRRKLVQEKKEE